MLELEVQPCFYRISWALFNLTFSAQPYGFSLEVGFLFSSAPCTGAQHLSFSSWEGFLGF